MCTYIPFSLDFLGIYVATEHGVELLLLYSRFSLVIYFIHNLLLFKKKFYLFLSSSLLFPGLFSSGFEERGLLPSCVVQASLVAEYRLQARELQQLWHMGSTAAAPGL